MSEELDYEFSVFMEDYKRGNFSFGRYFNEYEYEGEYSHNEIEEYQDKFIDKVKDFLHKNRPNEYVIARTWCVWVMTVDEAKSRNMYDYKERLVS